MLTCGFVRSKAVAYDLLAVTNLPAPMTLPSGGCWRSTARPVRSTDCVNDDILMGCRRMYRAIEEFHASPPRCRNKLRLT